MDEPPFLHGYRPPIDWPFTRRGWIIMSDDGWYWTGLGSQLDEAAAWSRNPRRALVEPTSPWATGPYGNTHGLRRQGRCYEVLLNEDQITMLPLHLWPPPVDAQGDADLRGDGQRRQELGDHHRSPGSGRATSSADGTSS